MQSINETKGIIVKLTWGFYYVDTEGEILECKARGAFRNKSQSPVVGDLVTVALKSEGYHSIEKIHE